MLPTFRRPVRRLLGLMAALMLLALVVVYLGPTALPLPLLQEHPAPSKSTPAPPIAFLQQLSTKTENKDNIKTNNKTTNAKTSGLKTTQISKKSGMEKLLEKKAEKKHPVKIILQEDLDPPVQDYVPENWVEVEKVHPWHRGNRIGHKKKPIRFPKLNPNDKYSPKVLRERALTFSNTSKLMAFVREQERRVRHIAAACRNITPNMADIVGGNRGPPTNLLTARDFIFDRKNHLMFCPVYKSASTSWTRIILELGGYWKKGSFRNLQAYLKKVYPKLNGLSATSLTAESTHFMIVRHPFERLVSCYRDKFENARKAYYYQHYGEQMVSRYRHFPPHFPVKQLNLLKEQVREKISKEQPVVMPSNPYANPVGPTFREFVDFVINAIIDDEHWRPHVVHCASCHMTYDFILRFESLNTESKLFLQYLNRSGEAQPRWENSYQGALTVEITCDYFNQIDLKRINALYLKYYKDFKLYEYNPEKYRKCAKDYNLLQSITNSTVQPHTVFNKS
ncbi:hypothetical protein Pcinc_004404 [Petrolisthes cinctipes]|uniref:Carbohydrate sulfotransferase n=1 Tax=Petrolisthes cinctipes TaxID=88211 RepID=A0AAE1GGY6_PETCI|nr:hypothetical protein Pcinc_004404 [Petrolisthes cinctipes]